MCRGACALASLAWSACDARSPSHGSLVDTSGGDGAGRRDETAIAARAPSGESIGGSAGSPSVSETEPNAPFDRLEPRVPDAAPPSSAADEGISIRNRRLWVGGEPFLIRGVCWNPVTVGATHPEGLDFAGFAERDVALMANLGVNVVRTYEPLLDPNVLDRLWRAQIYVINSVYPWGGAAPEAAVERVRAVKSHPATLMWAIGNEWNYNGLYAGLSETESVARLNEVARLIKAEDPSRPVATIHGELPSSATLAALSNVDVWGINVYRGIGFGSMFDDWRALSDKAMFVSEYGADAYDAGIGSYDPASQALAVAALAGELHDNATALHDSGVTLGGTVFELADEWWKDPAGSASEQDVGGSAPGGGPYPDGVFNEEWWGLVDIDRQPRPAYESLREVFQR